jgi:hypothetical protein
MNRIIILKRHFLSSIFTAIQLSKKNIFNFFNIFVIRFFFSIPFIRNKIYCKKNTKNIVNTFFFNQSHSNTDILKNIDEKGYFDTAISAQILNKLKKSFIENKFVYKFKDPSKNLNVFFPKNITLDDIIYISNQKKLSHLMISFDQYADNVINHIAKSDFFLSIAKSYLNSKKIILRSHCYISNPIKINECEKKNNAQYFHYDCDYKKFLKILIYLTDVNIDCGPHVFIPYTHKKRNFLHICTERLDDESIIKNYGQFGSKIFLGNAGRIIFEDTFGFHKGTTPTNGSRAIMILEYGVPPRIQYDGNEIII